MRSSRAALGAAWIVVASCGAGRAGLMSFEEFARVGRRAPHVLSASAGAGRLLYYGSRHTFDPADPQLGDIERGWNGFDPTLAIIEGGVPPAPATREEAVRRSGERGWVRFLAARDSVPTASLEPDRAVEVTALRREYTAEQIKVYYVLRQIPQYRSGGAPGPIVAFVERALQQTARVGGLAGPPRSVAELRGACARLLARLADCLDVTDDWFDPTVAEPRGYTNRLSRSSGAFRDRHMVDLITRAVRRGERVFAIAGFGHVVMQERALRAAMDDDPRRSW